MKISLTKKTAGVLAAFALALGGVGVAASASQVETSSPQALLMICNGANLS